MGRRRQHRRPDAGHRVKDAEHGAQRSWFGCAAAAAVTLTVPAPVAVVSQMCVETMMHLTCTNMPQEKLKEALDKVRP